MNQCMKVKGLFRMAEKVTKELKSRTGCEIITTSFPASNVMEFYVFDADGHTSTTEYKIVICKLDEHITDVDVYIEYLMKCLNSRIYVQGKINSKSKIVYNITESSEGLDIYFQGLDDTFLQGEKDLFYINENISIKASLEEGKFIIQDLNYGTTIIDFNMNTYNIQEVA